MKSLNMKVVGILKESLYSDVITVQIYITFSYISKARVSFSDKNSNLIAPTYNFYSDATNPYTWAYIANLNRFRYAVRLVQIA